MGVLKQIDRVIRWVTSQITSIFLLIIVMVVLYSVLLRYVFDAPLFWSDRIGVFANMSMVLFGLSLTVRNRELIAMQGLYELISKPAALMLETFWNAVILIFALMFTWFGAEAAINMPGQYWDFQDFCIDFGEGEGSKPGFLLMAVKLIESGVGAIVRPFCVDGAVPQKYLAMLMPASGVLMVIASLAVLMEDIQEIITIKKGRAAPGEARD